METAHKKQENILSKKICGDNVLNDHETMDIIWNLASFFVNVT